MPLIQSKANRFTGAFSSTLYRFRSDILFKVWHTSFVSVISRVFIYTRRYPGFALGTLSCAILTTLCGLVYPRLTRYVIDEVVVGNRTELLLPMCLGVAAAFLARDGLNSLRIILNNSFEQQVIFDIRSDLYNRLQHLPVGFFDERASGDLMTRLGDDVTNMERVLIDGIEQGIVALLQILIVTLLLFQANALLAMWALVPLPFLLMGALIYTTTAHQRYRIQRNAASALNALLLDNLQGIRQIKAFVREAFELLHFNERNEQMRQGMLKVMRAWALYSPSMNFFAGCGIVAVLFFGGKAVINGVLTKGQLVEFLLYTAFLYDPIGRLHQLNQLLQAGRAAGTRIFEILDAKPELSVVEATSSSDKSSSIISQERNKIIYEQVSFQYRNDLPVLHDICLQVQEGQTIALVGPTGAGKSSLVNLLPRFYPYQKGRILLDGREINIIPLTELRRQIGIVTQEPFLFNGSIRENLLYGKLDANEKEIIEATKAANAFEFISALPEKLDTVVGERGIRLSVGEKQRLTIARALLKDPPILILDEATSSVDNVTERLIQEALERLLHFRTSIVIAHRLSTIQRADKILILDNGRIVEQGSHETLLAQNGFYYRLWMRTDNAFIV